MFIIPILIFLYHLPSLTFPLSPGEKAQSQIPLIMPDYMLVFAVPILANQPFFKDATNVEELLNVRACLWFILEPLMHKNETYSFGFYKALIEQMKNHKDAHRPEDELANHVSVCGCWCAGCFYSCTVMQELTTAFILILLIGKLEKPCKICLFC